MTTAATRSAAPEYRRPNSKVLDLMRKSPLAARVIQRWRLMRAERLDGPYDGSDLMPPGVDRPAPYPAYYTTKHVHGMMDPGWLHPGIGAYTEAVSKWGFYFNRTDVIHHWYRQLLDDLQPKRILDVGCGIGIATRELARMYPEAEVIGVDMSPPLVRFARRQAERDGVTNVRFYHRDFADLDCFEDESFDVVMEAYCLHEVPTFQGKACLEEMTRLVRPGGRLVFVDWPPAETPEEYERRKRYITISEPYMLEYLDLQLEQTLPKLGLQDVERVTVVGRNMLLKADKPTP
jgi:ubiquinone/menaquinone biosynthesis C-methylase UbiE